MNPARLTCPAQWLFLPYTSTLLLHQEFQREHVSSQTQSPFQLQWSVWTESCPRWGLPEALNSCGKLVMLTHQAGIQECFTMSMLTYSALISALNIYQLFSFRKLYALKGWGAGYLLFYCYFQHMVIPSVPIEQCLYHCYTEFGTTLKQWQVTTKLKQWEYFKYRV